MTESFSIKAMQYDGIAYTTWHSSSSNPVVLDRIYPVLKILDKGFLICHDNAFFVIGFEYAIKTTPLEELL